MQSLYLSHLNKNDCYGQKFLHLKYSVQSLYSLTLTTWPNGASIIFSTGTLHSRDDIILQTHSWCHQCQSQDITQLQCAAENSTSHAVQCAILLPLSSTLVKKTALLASISPASLISDRFSPLALFVTGSRLFGHCHLRLVVNTHWLQLFWLPLSATFSWWSGEGHATIL